MTTETTKLKHEIEEKIYSKILPTWQATKPSIEAQSIRAGLDLENRFDEELPDWVWLIADIAAQRAFEKAGFKTTPSKAKGDRL